MPDFGKTTSSHASYKRPMPFWTSRAAWMSVALLPGLVLIGWGARGLLRGRARDWILIASIKEDGSPREPYFSLVDKIHYWRSFMEPNPLRVAPSAATETPLQRPSGIAVDQNGNVYIADRSGLIWRIDHSLRAEVYAGTGRHGSPRSDIPALEANFGRPEGMRIDSNNNLYIADHRSNMVVKVGPDGVLHRVAGSGRRGYGGDGGPAAHALLDQPYDIAVDKTGRLYLADFQNHRIRTVDREGIISTLAGTGTPGYSGDGGPAAKAQLRGPLGVTVDNEGRVIIADSHNHVVRRINSDGTIVTIAGTPGKAGYAGDDGAALSARFNSPEGMSVDQYDDLYIADEHNHCIRVVDRDGIVRTAAGTGELGTSGDGEAARESELRYPESISVLRDGTILFTESETRRVRIVTPDGIVGTFAGISPSLN